MIGRIAQRCLLISLVAQLTVPALCKDSEVSVSVQSFQGTQSGVHTASPEHRTSVSTTRPTKFDSAKWRHDRYLETVNRRANMVKDLLQNYKLKGMTRRELYSLLGAPDKSLKAFARYDVFVSSELLKKATACLDFAFENNVVTNFRFVAGQNRHSWKDVSSETQQNLAKCNPDYSGVVIIHYPGRRGNVRSTVKLPLSPDDALLETGVKHGELGLMTGIWKPHQYKYHYRSAVKAYQKFLEIYPDEVKVWRKLGFAELALEHFDAAIKDYSHVIEVEPGYDGYQQRALANLKLGKLDDAIADYSSTIDLLHPRVNGSSDRKFVILGDSDWYAKWAAVRAYSYRALARLKNGQTDLAIADLDCAINIDVDEYLPLFIRGEVFLNQSKFERAIADFTEIIHHVDKRTTIARPVFEERARAFEELGLPMKVQIDRNSAKSCEPKYHPELKWIMGYLNY